jgi:hypothetical protein
MMELLLKPTAIALPWYLSGDIPLANCIGAYKPKDAATLADSYINLPRPGTNNASVFPGYLAPSLAAGGWDTRLGGSVLRTGIVPAAGWSLIVRFSELATSVKSQVLAGSIGGPIMLLQPRFGGSNAARLTVFARGASSSIGAAAIRILVLSFPSPPS